MYFRSNEDVRACDDVRTELMPFVQSQYAGSSRMVSILEGCRGHILPDADIALFYDMEFNVKTAQGKGLDAWGNIVGISRDIPRIQTEYPVETIDDVLYSESVLSPANTADLKLIGGKTLVWNQLFEPRSEPITSDGITFTNTNGLITTSGVATADGWVQAGIFYQNDNSVVGDKLLFTMTPSGTADTFYMNVANPYWTIVYDNVLFTKTANTTAQAIRFYYKSGTDMNGKQFAFMGTNLTKMYGSGNEPSTVAEFQQTFPAVWYAYNPGSLLSAGVTEVVSKKADTTEIATYSIPAEVQALEGYGWSVQVYTNNVYSGDVYNQIDFENKKYIQNVGKVTLNGSTSWTWDTGNALAYTIIPNGFIIDNTTQHNTYVMSSNPSITSTSWGRRSMYTYTMGMYYGQTRLFCKSENFASANDVKTYFTNNPTDVNYVLQTPVETDISAYLTDDNLIEVEAGGTLTFENQNGGDYRIPVPVKFDFLNVLKDRIILDDDNYRKLILHKAAANIMDSTLASMNYLLKKLYPEHTCYVQLASQYTEVSGTYVDNNPMEIVYFFNGETLTPTELSVFAYIGDYNRGAGVGWNINEFKTDAIFGFYGSLLQPFDQGVFVF